MRKSIDTSHLGKAWRILTDPSSRLLLASTSNWVSNRRKTENCGKAVQLRFLPCMYLRLLKSLRTPLHTSPDGIVSV